MNKPTSPSGASQADKQDNSKPAASKDSKQGKDATSHQKADTDERKDEGAGGGKKQARKH